MNQAASEAWHSDDRKDQVFSNSTIEPTLRGFKVTDDESIKVKYETTLRGVDLSNVQTLNITYNQILNIPYDQLATFDYIFIDEAHVLATDMSYRSDVITKLLSYLIEFVARKQKAKTKIVFMTGTPSVETKVIPELMDEHNIKRLFQRIIIKKDYKITPIMHLTHLDTNDKEERQDAVIDKINEYIKQGRKVCHIFNNKAKMDQYIREIQSKLSPEIKVGLFYSGSTGECTNNILMGLFGKYDVVLTTSYFVNGINIERDGLTEEEILQGKKSKQKYGVVIDLGQGHTRINSMDTVQTINRFRNRLCHTTVFLPKIFKPTLNNKHKFDFSHTARVLRGINKWNYHLLTANKDAVEYTEEPEELKEKIHLVRQVRRNPIYVSTLDIDKASKDEEDRVKVTDMMSKGLRVYDDWFFSLEGFHYIAKDAGIAPIIKHKSGKTQLEKMDSDHELLENSVVESFLNNGEALEYLTNQIDPEKRIQLKASDVVTDPESTEASNFRVKDLKNDKYIVVGDFHSSHERSLNYIIRAHLNFSHWYGTDEAMRIFRYLMDDNVNMTPGDSSHYTSLISKYLNSCKLASPKKFTQAYGFLRAIDILADKNVGITKHVYHTSISYVIQDPRVVDTLFDEWANAQYDMTMYKIDHSESKEKEELKSYYSNKALMKEYDIKELKFDLGRICNYSPYNESDQGELKSVEQLHITRVIRSPKLMRPHDDFDTIDWISPPPMDYSKYEDANKTARSDEYIWVNKLTNELSSLLSDEQYESLTEILSDSDEFNSSSIANDLERWRATQVELTEQASDRVMRLINEMIISYRNNSKLFYNTFQLTEYLNHTEGQIHKRLPSMDKLFFVEPEFDLSDLEENLNLDDMAWLQLNRLVLNEIGNADLPKTNPRYWVAIDSNKIPILVRKTKGEFCRGICEYALQDDKEFVLNSGIPVKDKSKGIYKHTTFARDYLKNTYKDNQIKNYTFQLMTIDVEELERLRDS